MFNTVLGWSIDRDNELEVTRILRVLVGLPLHKVGRGHHLPLARWRSHDQGNPPQIRVMFLRSCLDGIPLSLFLVFRVQSPSAAPVFEREDEKRNKLGHEILETTWWWGLH